MCALEKKECHLGGERGEGGNSVPWRQKRWAHCVSWIYRDLNVEIT